MKNKAVSYWIWIAVVLVVAIVLTSVTQYRFADEELKKTNEVVAQQTVSLGSLAVYIAAIFSCNIFGAIALLIGSALGALFIGSYAYIIPIVVARLVAFTVLAIIRRRTTASWKNCIISAVVVEGILILFTFLYELIFLPLEFSAVSSAFFAHLIEGGICGIIGLVLLKLFAPKAPEAETLSDFMAAKETKKSGRNLK